MKKLFPLMLLAIIAAACTGRHSGTGEAEYVTYRGWDSCVKLTDGTVTAIVNPTYGAQVLYFGIDSVNCNVLWADSAINAFTVDSFIATRRAPDAGRSDIGPERVTDHIHDSIWAGAYAVTDVSGRSVTLESVPMAKMGVKFTKKYTLAGDATLRVDLTMTNVCDSAVRYNVWTRTLLPSGGLYMAKATPTEKYPNGFSEYTFDIDSLIPGVRTDRVKLTEGIFTAFPGGESPADCHKFCINTTPATDGDSMSTAIYMRAPYIFVKRFDYDPQGVYDMSHGIDYPNIIYFDSRFIEVEPNSPMITLKPGESYTFTETWQLLPY